LHWRRRLQLGRRRRRRQLWRDVHLHLLPGLLQRVCERLVLLHRR
jgi:hypothetical protein